LPTLDNVIVIFLTHLPRNFGFFFTPFCKKGRINIAKFVFGFCFLEVYNNVDEFELRLEQQYKVFLHLSILKIDFELLKNAFRRV